MRALLGVVAAVALIGTAAEARTRYIIAGTANGGDTVNFSFNVQQGLTLFGNLQVGGGLIASAEFDVYGVRTYADREPEYKLVPILIQKSCSAPVDLPCPFVSDFPGSSITFATFLEPYPDSGLGPDGRWRRNGGDFTTTDIAVTFAGKGPVGYLLQAVDLSLVPEPGAWALMIAGFGLVGGRLRGRRTASA